MQWGRRKDISGAKEWCASFLISLFISGSPGGDSLDVVGLFPISPLSPSPQVSSYRV